MCVSKLLDIDFMCTYVGFFFLIIQKTVRPRMESENELVHVDVL